MFYLLILDSFFSRRDIRLTYGAGLYFAENPLYAMHFGHFSNAVTADGQWHRINVTVLLCKVNVGRQRDFGTEECPSLVMPPEGFDSVTGTTTNGGGTRMHVVYANAQVVVTHVVELQTVTPCRPQAYCKSLHS